MRYRIPDRTQQATYSLHSLAQRPESRDSIRQLSEASWPVFLLHSDIEHWHLLFEMFPECQLLIRDATDALIAVGHAIPLVWGGSAADLPQSIEAILLRALEARQRRQAPNTFSAVAAMVSPGHRGQNLSRRVIEAMKALAREEGCTSLIAPVRPTWKSRYPLTPMERYVQWTRDDGAPFDPWIRVHWRLGALPLCVAPSTLTVEGTVAEWEAWTEMAFPESGAYVVPGALQPVQIDRERNVGRYEDPNYWMKHAV